MAENFIHLYWPSSPKGAVDGPKPETPCTPNQDSRDSSVGSPLLPSFETFCKGRNDASLSSDQSTTGSESSFSIENLIRAASSVPLASTPDTRRDPILGQTWKDDIENTGANLTGAKLTAPQRVNKRHEDKPPYTYIAMCVMAIEMSQEKALTQVEIREQLQKMFPFFNGSYTGWKESIRACLSRSKYFIRMKAVGESRQSIWAVDLSTLTPGMFKKHVYKGSGTHYKEFLHEELGVPPVCSKSPAATPEKKRSVKDMIPDIHCYKPSQTVTADTISESEDFLHARRDSGLDAEDDNRITTPSSTISSTEHADNLTNRKRKLDVDPVETAPQKSCKTQRTSHTDDLMITGVTNNSRYPNHNQNNAMTSYQHAYNMAGYWNNYGHAYQNYQNYPHHNQVNYGQHRMPAYYPYHWQAQNYYGQMQVAPGRQYVPHHYNAMTHAAHMRYQNMLSDFNLAQQMLHRYQQRDTQISTEQNNFQYDYKWYNAPSAESNGIDLSVSSNEEKHTER